MNPCPHPEEDMDLALGGGLPAAQRRDLNLHLAACPACAAHMAAAQRTKETLAERPYDEQLNRRAVERAMTGLFPPRFARLRYRQAFQLGFALAGLLLVAGLAGAALWWSQRPSSVALAVPGAIRCNTHRFLCPRSGRAERRPCPCGERLCLAALAASPALGRRALCPSAGSAGRGQGRRSHRCSPAAAASLSDSS